MIIFIIVTKVARKMDSNSFSVSFSDVGSAPNKSINQKLRKSKSLSSVAFAALPNDVVVRKRKPIANVTTASRSEFCVVNLSL